MVSASLETPSFEVVAPAGSLFAPTRSLFAFSVEAFAPSGFCAFPSSLRVSVSVGWLVVLSAIEVSAPFGSFVGFSLLEAFSSVVELGVIVFDPFFFPVITKLEQQSEK